MYILITFNDDIEASSFASFYCIPTWSILSIFTPTKNRALDGLQLTLINTQYTLHSTQYTVHTLAMSLQLKRSFFLRCQRCLLPNKSYWMLK